MDTKRIKATVIALMLILGTVGAQAATNALSPSIPAGAQQAAFGVESIKLGGVFGHRIDTMIKGNLYMLDMEKTFLSYFRNKAEKSGYRALGKTMDAAVYLAAYSGDTKMIAWKDHWIDELISTQNPDGYIGMITNGPLRRVAPYDTHEKSTMVMALVSDYRVFGRKGSLAAAKKLADQMIETWGEDIPANFIYSMEEHFIELSDATGDKKYVNWIADTFVPGGKLCAPYLSRLGGDPLKPLNMEGVQLYRWMDIYLTLLRLNRYYPNPFIKAAWPQMIAWIKDGGSLPQASFTSTERFRHSQITRSGMERDDDFLSGCSSGHATSGRTTIGDACSLWFITHAFDRMLEEMPVPDPYLGDVIERTCYNGMFASQTPDGRHLAYDLSVEGTRVVNPADFYCCPGNLRRAFAYLPGYICRKLKDGLYVNLYAESEATIALAGGVKMKIKQVTDYPISGNICVQINPASPVKTPLLFRIPSWCDAPVVKLNGKAVADVKPGTFLRLDREWKGGDVVALDFPMKWRFERGIREQEGRACLLRGPVAYTLNPFRSGLDWYQDMKIEGWGIQRVTKKSIALPNLAEHMKTFARLEEITLDPKTLSAPKADTSVHPFGQSVTVKGWLGEPKGSADQTFTFTEFVDPQGRKVFFKLSDLSVAVDDELFGKEIHEKTVYPTRWEAVKKGLDASVLAKVPGAGLEQALLIKPMRGSYAAETAQGELAGRPAWMSASIVKTGKRRMEFRVYDPKFEKGATPEVTLSVLYFDKGNCKVSLIYDSTDSVVRVRGRAPGAYKPGGDFQIGNSGTIKRQDFKLPDARFGKNLLLESTDFRLVADKDVDFVILGAFLQLATK